jgi:hypothetical protein
VQGEGKNCHLTRTLSLSLKRKEAVLYAASLAFRLLKMLKDLVEGAKDFWAEFAPFEVA